MDERAQLALEQLKNWRLLFTDRDQKHIAFCENYKEHFAHGAPGHIDYMLVAGMAKFIDGIAKSAVEAFGSE